MSSGGRRQAVATEIVFVFSFVSVFSSVFVSNIVFVSVFVAGKYFSMGTNGGLHAAVATEIAG